MNTAISPNRSESTATLVTILVENLAEDTREEDIGSLFGQYGYVASVWVIPGIPDRRGNDLCYLEMGDRQAKAAISALNGKTFRGSILRVGEAHVQPGGSGKPRRVAEDERARGPIRLVYEVASVEKAEMPAGTQGDDWCRYVLASGSSRITGFHRGSCAEVREYATHCAEEFNLRSIRGKTARPMGPPRKR
jgi:RNA recognition motif-containing protein